MEIIKSNSFVDIYFKLLTDLLDSKKSTTLKIRGTFVNELNSEITIVFNNIKTMKNIFIDSERKVALGLLEGEFLWILSGSNKLKDVSIFNKHWRGFSDDNLTLYGAYGYRLNKQIVPLVNKLKKDLYTRQAIITIYDKEDIKSNSKDIPCNIILQFKTRVQNDCPTLNLTTYCRSNDIILGFPYDVVHWHSLLKLVYNSLKRNYPQLVLGNHTHIVNSLHLYDTDINLAKRIIQQDKNKIEQDSYCWNISIELESALLEARNVFESGRFSTDTIFKNAYKKYNKGSKNV